MSEPAQPAAPSRPARPAQARSRARARARRRRRLRGWWLVPVGVVFVLLVGELFARVVGPDIPKTAGTDEETLVKTADIEARSPARTDVVMLGASETAAGMVPSALDAASTRFTGAYNAAMRGASPKTNQLWADRVVFPELKPRVAVVGVLPWELAVLDGEGGAYQHQSDLAYADAIDEADPDLLGRIDRAFADRSALIRYRDQMREPTAVLKGIRAWYRGKPEEVNPALDPKVLRANIAPSGESLEYRDRPEVQSPDPQIARQLNRVSKGRFELGDLEDLLRQIQADGVEPVLVLAPLDRDLLEASGFDFTRIDAVAERVVKLGERLGVPVLDSFRARYPTDQFHDKQHLNAQGAARWSREIGEWLDQRCADSLADACPPSA